MDCTNAHTLLDVYVDGELDPLRNLEIEEHLHSCSRCAQSYGDRQIMRGVLKTESLYFKAPADLQKRIQRSVRQAAKAEAPAGWFSGSWFKIAAPLATAALVILKATSILPPIRLAAVARHAAAGVQSSSSPIRISVGIFMALSDMQAG